LHSDFDTTSLWKIRQSQTSDFAVSAAPGELLWAYALCASPIPGHCFQTWSQLLYAKYITYCHLSEFDQASVKFGHVVLEIREMKQRCRRTHRHADRNTSHLYVGWSMGISRLIYSAWTKTESVDGRKDSQPILPYYSAYSVRLVFNRNWFVRV